MGDKIQAIRGMNDLLPDVTPSWRALEKIFSEVLQSYGYDEIRTPVLEHTRLFKRSIGEVTDIIEKEMYTFEDLNGDSLTLRPEGTAAVVRSAIEHGLLHNQQQKLWYCGPMFRHERPQKGRYRQFYQLGVEAFGFDGNAVEIELLLLCQTLWSRLGIADYVNLEINSIGTIEERETYKASLVQFLQSHFDALDEDSKRRLQRNPLRILDSKNPDMSQLVAQAPTLIDSLGEESRTKFDTICAALQELGISYSINYNLVRGLDYYGHTVFEWVTDKLGSQATVCAGGRYDSLVAQLGGKSVSATGFALGMERLLLLMQDVKSRALSSANQTFIYFISDSDAARLLAMKLADTLRKKDIAAGVVINLTGGSFKSQFKKADKSGARFAIIIGEDELQDACLTIKDLRVEDSQLRIAQSQLLDWYEDVLSVS